MTFQKANPNLQTDTPRSGRKYVIGDDVISQQSWVLSTISSPRYLLYDGHGSTRQLAYYTGTDVTIADSYSYDGYGVLLQGESVASSNPGKVLSTSISTNLLYAGEQFDTNSQQYYLRARWYNPLSGLFNQFDPYAGNTIDPLSLHKYNFCAANPINRIDPSGLDWFFAGLGTAVHREIQNMYIAEHIGNISNAGKSIPGLAGVLKPDIMDFTLKEIGEIKPLSIYGLSTGPIQLWTYLAVANRLGIPGAIDKQWTSSTWDVGVRQVFVPEYADRYIVVTVGNVNGLIFYKAFKKPKNRSNNELTAVEILKLKEQFEGMLDLFKSTSYEDKGVFEGLVAYLDQATNITFDASTANTMVRNSIAVITAVAIFEIGYRLNLSFATKGLY